MFLFLATIFLVISASFVFISDCDGCRQNYTYAEAKSYFYKHEIQLNQLVKLVRDCKYAEQINNEPDLNDSGLTCLNHSRAYEDKIANKLKSAHILWVVLDWWTHIPNGKDKHQFTVASFVLTSCGIATSSGSASVIDYYAKANPPGKGMRALTPAPHHWFYEAITDKE